MLMVHEGTIDLEDARVTRIDRGPTRLTISLADVGVVAGGDRAIVEAAVVLEGVRSEAAVSYGDGNVATTVGASEESPLDLVEVWECSAGVLTLEGYKSRVPWVTWSITASSIRAELRSNPTFQRTATRPLN